MEGITIGAKFTNDKGTKVEVDIEAGYGYSAIITGYKEDEYDSIPKMITIMTGTITDLCNKIKFLDIEGIYTKEIENFLIGAKKLNDELEKI